MAGHFTIERDLPGDPETFMVLEGRAQDRSRTKPTINRTVPLVPDQTLLFMKHESVQVEGDTNDSRKKLGKSREKHAMGEGFCPWPSIFLRAEESCLPSRGPGGRQQKVSWLACAGKGLLGGRGIVLRMAGRLEKQLRLEPDGSFVIQDQTTGTVSWHHPSWAPRRACWAGGYCPLLGSGSNLSSGARVTRPCWVRGRG